MPFTSGDIVTIILHSPREKLVGVLGEVSTAGISARVIDLEYFDDWSRSVAAGESYLSMSDQFFPMWRVERMTRDERSGEIPSMAEQFASRTGRSLTDV
ncbi:MAG: hypothetical protein ACK4S4_07740 [Pyrinomonadaceae bacterium]